MLILGGIWLGRGIRLKASVEATGYQAPVRVGRISDSVMRRMIEDQHAVQYGYRLLHPTVCVLRVNDIGGNVVLVLGAKWRFYYYAHLHSMCGHAGQWVKTGEPLGTVGSTGNAQGKPPHLHFSIRSLLPLFWQYQADKPQALLTMFYVDPGVYLNGAGGSL